MKAASLIASRECHAAATPCSTGSLAAGEVALWRVVLDDVSDRAFADLAASLSADECERAAAFRFERDRRRFTVARGVLRALVAGYTGADAASLLFHYGENGKPSLAGAEEGALSFNLSHSEGLAVYAFTLEGQVGVDIERRRHLPEREHIAASCLLPRERAAVQQAPAARREEAFFEAWTRQEALLKALGIGLGASPSDVSARPTPILVRLNPAPGFSGALAAPAASHHVSCRTWADERGRWAPTRMQRFPLNAAKPAELTFL